MNSQAQPQGAYDASGQWQPGFHDARGTWYGGFYDEHGQWQPGFYGPGNQWYGGFYDEHGTWHAGYRTAGGSWEPQHAPSPAVPPAEVPQAAGAAQPSSEQPTQAVVSQLSQDPVAYAYPAAEQQAEDEGEPKGRGGLFALVAFLLVLLGGGVAAGWWFFLREDAEEPEPAATEEATDDPTEEATEEPADEGTEPPGDEGTDDDPDEVEPDETDDPAEEPVPDEEEPSYERNPADMQVAASQTFQIPDAPIGSDAAPVTYTMNRAKLTQNHQDEWDLWGLDPQGAAPAGHIWLVVDMSISMPQNQSVSFDGGAWTLTATDQNGVSDQHTYDSQASGIGEWPAGGYGAIIAVPEDAEEIELDAELEIFYGGSGTTTVTSTEPVILEFPLAD
ncbi:hypothetical protein [Nesterenkonia ebinurensis]|uniref:hypothetical protein n=1 Tax=Nesterenkonia ebinurensis TaxID=2608252 RepID=UPI00123DB22F|nr:hypothetical protein [Nesterenkonia ebinurensis]